MAAPAGDAVPEPSVDSATKHGEVDTTQKTCGEAPPPIAPRPSQEEEADTASAAEEATGTTEAEEQSGIAAETHAQEERTDQPEDHKVMFCFSAEAKDSAEDEPLGKRTHAPYMAQGKLLQACRKEVARTGSAPMP